MGKRRPKAPGVPRPERVDTDALARRLVRRGLASPQILEGSGISFTREARELRPRRSDR